MVSMPPAHPTARTLHYHLDELQRRYTVMEERYCSLGSRVRRNALGPFPEERFYCAAILQWRPSTHKFDTVRLFGTLGPDLVRSRKSGRSESHNEICPLWVEFFDDVKHAIELLNGSATDGDLSIATILLGEAEEKADWVEGILEKICRRPDTPSPYSSAPHYTFGGWNEMCLEVFSADQHAHCASHVTRDGPALAEAIGRLHSGYARLHNCQCDLCIFLKAKAGVRRWFAFRPQPFVADAEVEMPPPCLAWLFTEFNEYGQYDPGRQYLQDMNTDKHDAQGRRGRAVKHISDMPDVSREQWVAWADRHRQYLSPKSLKRAMSMRRVLHRAVVVPPKLQSGEQPSDEKPAAGLGDGSELPVRQDAHPGPVSNIIVDPTSLGHSKAVPMRPPEREPARCSSESSKNTGLTSSSPAFATSEKTVSEGLAQPQPSEEDVITELKARFDLPGSARRRTPYLYRPALSKISLRRRSKSQQRSESRIDPMQLSGECASEPSPFPIPDDPCAEKASKTKTTTQCVAEQSTADALAKARRTSGTSVHVPGASLGVLLREYIARLAALGHEDQGVPIPGPGLSREGLLAAVNQESRTNYPGIPAERLAALGVQLFFVNGFDISSKLESSHTFIFANVVPQLSLHLTERDPSKILRLLKYLRTKELPRWHPDRLNRRTGTAGVVDERLGSEELVILVRGAVQDLIELCDTGLEELKGIK